MYVGMYVRIYVCIWMFIHVWLKKKKIFKIYFTEKESLYDRPTITGKQLFVQESALIYNVALNAHHNTRTLSCALYFGHECTNVMYVCMWTSYKRCKALKASCLGRSRSTHTPKKHACMYVYCACMYAHSIATRVVGCWELQVWSAQDTSTHQRSMYVRMYVLCRYAHSVAIIVVVRWELQVWVARARSIRHTHACLGVNHLLRNTCVVVKKYVCIYVSMYLCIYVH